MVLTDGGGMGWSSSWNNEERQNAGLSPELGSVVLLPLDLSMTLAPEGD